MRPFAFRPKLISSLREYSRRTFAADLMAGIIVGIVALPLAIAFGIASGVSCLFYTSRCVLETGGKYPTFRCLFLHRR